VKLYDEFGTLEVCDLDDNCFLIVNMEVRPEFRGQGHGKHMVKEAKKHCLLGDMMFASSEEGAVGFWEKIGEEMDIDKVPLAVKIAVKGFKHDKLKLFRV
jgi:ribosomal protein S18 acetylase RimI-like enzyme